MTTKRQTEIIDQVGADDWDAIIEAFGGGTVGEIENTLDDMFPDDNNGELAQMIYNEVNASRATALPSWVDNGSIEDFLS